jgi:hypothetical protein
LRALLRAAKFRDDPKNASYIAAVPAPASDWKVEGAHEGPWTVEAAPAPIILPADCFCDGAAFNPDALPPPAKAVRSTLHIL